MNEGKNPLASKTLWFNALALILAIAMGYGFDTFEPVAEIEPLAAGILALLTIAAPVINMFLRLVTRQPINLFGK